MSSYIISLGSSSISGKKYIKKVFNILRASFNINIKAKSKIHHTVAVKCKKYLMFYNATMLISTNLMPDALWFELFYIERQLGRLRPYKNSPRIMDLDILWANNKEIKTLNLEIPHNELHNRAFFVKSIKKYNNKYNIFIH